MKNDLSGRLALDTSAMIDLLFSTPAGLKLKEGLKEGVIEVHTTELHIAELRYILCRRLGLMESNEKVDRLLASGYIIVENMTLLVSDASKYKCERAISLADCFCLALARRYFYSAVFVRREKDLVTEIQKKPFDVAILFLEDHE